MAKRNKDLSFLTRKYNFIGGIHAWFFVVKVIVMLVFWGCVYIAGNGKSRRISERKYILTNPPGTQVHGAK